MYNCTDKNVILYIKVRGWYIFENVRVRSANKNFPCINSKNLELFPTKNFEAKPDSTQLIEIIEDELMEEDIVEGVEPHNVLEKSLNELTQKTGEPRTSQLLLYSYLI